MDPIFPQPGHSMPASLPALPPMRTAPVTTASTISEGDRISRIAALGQEDATAGLLWLAMNFPAVCDATLDKAEADDADDDYPCQEPEPICGQCGASIGIFLRHGTNWRHYHGDGTSQIEVFDPGHEPQVAWRLPGMRASL